MDSLRQLFEADLSPQQIAQQNGAWARAQLPLMYSHVDELRAEGRFFLMGGDLQGAQAVADRLKKTHVSIELLLGMARQLVDEAGNTPFIPK